MKKNGSKLILLVDLAVLCALLTWPVGDSWVTRTHVCPPRVFEQTRDEDPEFPCPIRVVPIRFDNTTNVRRVRMERDSAVSITFDRNRTYSHIFRR